MSETSLVVDGLTTPPGTAFLPSEGPFFPDEPQWPMYRPNIMAGDTSLVKVCWLTVSFARTIGPSIIDWTTARYSWRRKNETQDVSQHSNQIFRVYVGNRGNNPYIAVGKVFVNSASGGEGDRCKDRSEKKAGVRMMTHLKNNNKSPSLTTQHLPNTTNPGLMS